MRAESEFFFFFFLGGGGGGGEGWEAFGGGNGVGIILAFFYNIESACNEMNCLKTYA